MVWGAWLSSAAASEADPAKAAYNLALHHYKAGRFAKSAPMFHEAFAIRPVPVFLYNAARSEQKAGQLDKAAASYRKLLAIKSLPGTVGKKASGYLAEVDAALAKRDAEKARQAKLLAARKKVEARESARNRLLGIALGGVSVALIGTGGVMFGVYATDQAELEDKLADKDSGEIVGISYEEYTAEADRIDRIGIMAGVGIGLGFAALAGALFTLGDDGERDSARVDAAPWASGRGLSVNVRF